MRELATYMSRALRKPLPKEVVEKTKHHVLDTIAAMVSGSRLLPGKKAISYVKTLGGTRSFTWFRISSSCPSGRPDEANSVP